MNILKSWIKTNNRSRGLFVIFCVMSLYMIGVYFIPPIRMFVNDFVGTLIFVLAFFGATSIAFYNYLDSVMKDLPAMATEYNVDKIIIIIDKTSTLKTKVIKTSRAVLCLLLLERLVFSLQGLLPEFVGLRCGLFVLCCIFIYTQFKAFIQASEYRKIICYQLINDKIK